MAYAFSKSVEAAVTAAPGAVFARLVPAPPPLGGPRNFFAALERYALPESECWSRAVVR